MKKVLKNLVPFIFILIFTPIYSILDSLFFVEIFGCGCVPIAQTNMLNIPFNANNLRRLVYSVLTIAMVILAVKFSKSFSSKYIRILYCVAVFLVNAAVSLWVCSIMMWG